jgi:hypothetical protein
MGLVRVSALSSNHSKQRAVGQKQAPSSKAVSELEWDILQIRRFLSQFQYRRFR